MNIKRNRDPQSLWQPIEIRPIDSLVHLPGHPEALLLTLPLRETATGVTYCARVSKVEMVENEIVLSVRPCVLNKKAKDFLWISNLPQVFGTAVLFLPKGANHQRYGFPYVKGTRGDVLIDGVEYTTYFLHSGSLQ